jgi:hypothetical protein
MISERGSRPCYANFRTLMTHRVVSEISLENWQYEYTVPFEMQLTKLNRWCKEADSETFPLTAANRRGLRPMRIHSTRYFNMAPFSFHEEKITDSGDFFVIYTPHLILICWFNRRGKDLREMCRKWGARNGSLEPEILFEISGSVDVGRDWVAVLTLMWSVYVRV